MPELPGILSVCIPQSCFALDTYRRECEQKVWKEPSLQAAVPLSSWGLKEVPQNTWKRGQLRGLCLLPFIALGALVGQPSLLTLSAAIHEGSVLHEQQSVHPS